MFHLGPRSLSRLKGVHPDLVKVVQRAIEITTVDFVVLEGLRSPERQKILVDSGASWTLNSRHITGHAVDLGAWVDDQVDWSWPLYDKIAKAMLEASKELKIPIEWGGMWKVRDGPHYQLPKAKYP